MENIKKIIKNFVRNSDYGTETAFTDLPARKRKKIMFNTVRDAVEMQLALISEYDKKFGKTN